MAFSCDESILAQAITKIVKYKCSKCENVQEQRSCASELEEFKQKAFYCKNCQGDMSFDSVEVLT